MQLDPSIQHELRALAERGDSVADLVRMLRSRAGMGRGEGRLLVSAYLMRTFAIPLHKAAEVSGWVGFGDGEGTATDEEIEVRLGEYVRST